MNSFVAVHQLDDTEVRGDTCEHVRIVATEMLLVHQEVDQLFESDLGGFVQILVEANGNVIRWCLGSRPMDLHVLAHNELKCAIQRSFHGSAIDFTVTLSGMTVSDFKERAARVDREIENCAGDEIFIVHVTAMDPWRTAADAAGPLWRRDTHASKKGLQRDIDSLSK